MPGGEVGASPPWAAGHLPSRRRGILWFRGTRVPSNTPSTALTSLRALPSPPESRVTRIRGARIMGSSRRVGGARLPCPTAAQLTLEYFRMNGVLSASSLPTPASEIARVSWARRLSSDVPPSSPSIRAQRVPRLPCRPIRRTRRPGTHPVDPPSLTCRAGIPCRRCLTP